MNCFVSRYSIETNVSSRGENFERFVGGLPYHGEGSANLLVDERTVRQGSLSCDRHTFDDLPEDGVLIVEVVRHRAPRGSPSFPFAGVPFSPHFFCERRKQRESPCATE